MAEIDKLAAALACPRQRLRLAVVWAQVAQLVREVQDAGKARVSAL